MHQDIAFRTAYLVAASAEDAEEAARRDFSRRGERWPLPAGKALPAVAPRDRRERGAQPSAFVDAAPADRLRALAQDRPGDAAPSPEATRPRGERRRVLLDAVARLREEQRLVVACRYFLDLDEADTAAVLGVRRGTVKSRLVAGLDRVRREEVRRTMPDLERELRELGAASSRSRRRRTSPARSDAPAGGRRRSATSPAAAPHRSPALAVVLVALAAARRPDRPRRHPRLFGIGGVTHRAGRRAARGRAERADRRGQTDRRGRDAVPAPPLRSGRRARPPLHGRRRRDAPLRLARARPPARDPDRNGRADAGDLVKKLATVSTRMRVVELGGVPDPRSGSRVSHTSSSFRTHLPALRATRSSGFGAGGRCGSRGRSTSPTP